MILLGFISTATPRADASDVTIRDLGTLPGDASSYASGVNNAGQVVGSSVNASLASRAFLWENGTMKDLGTLGGRSSEALAINDAGQVVGWSTNASGSHHAFLWENGGMRDIGALNASAPWAEARAINGAGEVAGQSFGASGAMRPFVWANGAMKDLGSLDGYYGRATGINNRGQVAGSSSAPGTDYRAFLWDNGTMTDLGALGPTGYSVAWGINDAGQVVGASYNATGQYRAFLWQHGTLTELGTLGGLTSEAFAINQVGQVVGTSGHAFLWDNGTMTDLGTLGGFHSEAQAMNDGGQVAGWSMTASGARHAALWTVPRPPAAQYPIRVLGSPPGYSFTVATAVNDAGQVALHGMSAPDRFHPFLWENGSFTDLGTVGGGNESFAQGINNAGQVVGWGYTSSGLSHAFLWENGTMTDLGVSLDRESAAYGINGAGQVVGSKANASGNSHAFLWYKGTSRDLGTLGGPFSDASAVNDAGQVIGWSAADASLANHAFLWENGTMKDLGIGTLGAAAYAINNGGQVVGSYTDGSRQEHAFLWQNGTTTDLGFWTPSAINDAGQIVGSRQSNTSDTRAVLWQNGIMSDLGAAPGDSDSQAYGINNAGQVVGTSWRKSDGIRRAVLWTVPLPAVHDVAVVSASASPAFADVGTQVTIAGRVSNQGTRPETFQVSAYAGPNLVGTTAVTDLAAGAARGVSFTWDTSSATAGSYRIRVEAAAVYNETNLGNNVHVAGTVLLSLPAKALASGTPSTTDVDIAISFHCTAMDGTPPFAFSWDFGDNTTGLGETASHAYARPGTMIAVCTVRDGSGNLASSSVTVVVSFAPSVVAAVNREAASPNYVLMFSARATGGSGGLTYTWDFGDRSSGTGNPITHAYATAGEYTASLTVRDTAGGTASSSVTVGISNVAVTATPSTTAAATGDGLTFTASAAGGAGGPFSFAWDFGDGTNATGASVTHAYSRPGSYTPRVTVTDASGTVQEKVLATITVRSGANPTNPTTTAAFDPAFIEGGAIVALAAVVIALYAIRRRPPER